MLRKFLPAIGLGMVLLSVTSLTASAQTLKVGDVVPKFEVTDDQGEAWNSDDHIGKRVVILYFYPSDFAFCCTRQAERYRDAQPELAKLNAEIIGISCDCQESHAAFKAAHRLNFALLADSDGGVARQFGVPLRRGGKAMVHDAAGQAVTDAQGDIQQFSRDWTAARWTFVIGTDGRVLHRDTTVSPVSDSKKMLEFARNLAISQICFRSR